MDRTGDSRVLRAALIEAIVLAAIFPLALFPSPERAPALLAIPALWVLRRFTSDAERSSALPSPPPTPPVPSPSVPSSLASDLRPQTSDLTPPASHFITRTPLDWPILLLAAMVLVSLYATYDIAVSLPKVAGMVFGIGVYYAAVSASRTARGWWAAFGAFVAGGVGIAGLGLVGMRWASKFPFLQAVIENLPARLVELPGAEKGIHPNETAGALVWVVPVLVALVGYVVCHPRAVFGWLHVTRLPKSSKLRKSGFEWPGIAGAAVIFVLLIVASLFTMGVLLLSQSRSAIIALGGILPWMALLSVNGRKARLALFALAAAGAGAAAIAVAVLGPAHVLELAAGPGAGYSSALSLDTLEGRVEVWSRAIYGIQDFAFTGMGMNTFRRVVHVLYPLFLIGPDTDLGHAHNVWLQAGLDLGIPGLIAYLALWVGAAWMLVRIWRASVERSTLNVERGPFNVPTFNVQRTLVLGFGGSLAASFVYGITDTVALGAKPGVLWWLLLGLIAGLHARVVEEMPASGDGGRARHAPHTTSDPSR